MKHLYNDWDAVVGRANRLLRPFAKRLYLGLPLAASRVVRGTLTGTPLRSGFGEMDRAVARRQLGLEPDQPTVLVTGGSLGADALNACVVESLPALNERGWYVVHVCGPGKERAAPSANYSAFDYVAEDWADLLAAADMVIARAGANTVFELLALKKPNLLIPLPATGSRGDQIDNAAYASAGGYSRVLAQSELSSERLLQEISALQTDLDQVQQQLASFEAPDAVAAIVAELERFLPKAQ